jgi:hypothetical protein
MKSNHDEREGFLLKTIRVIQYKNKMTTSEMKIILIYQKLEFLALLSFAAGLMNILFCRFC